MVNIAGLFRGKNSILALTTLAAVITSTRASGVQLQTPPAAAAIRTTTPTSQPATSCQPRWLPTFGGASGVDDVVDALTVFDDGSGPALYAGGEFTTAGGSAAYRIAKWGGTSWAALGRGTNGTVTALTVFDDGSGPSLIADGEFGDAGGEYAAGIARWRGSRWAQLGLGVSGGGTALTVFDDGSGSALYATSFFPHASGGPQNGVVRWNGVSWVEVGSPTNGNIDALTVFNDGTGPALYAAGYFTTAGGVAANRIAKWSGASWVPLGTGMDHSVNALTVFDDGSGPALIAAGYFTTAGGVAASRIAKWNGSTWVPLGSGISAPGYVNVLTVFDDGNGAALYAAGEFTGAGGVAADSIAKWNGSSWAALGTGFDGIYVSAMTVFDDGSGPALYAGGYFTAVGGVEANHIAKWGLPTGCGAPGTSSCEPSAAGVIPCPCANAPAGGGLGCNNSSNTGGSQLSATGIARLSYDTVVFTTSGEKPTATSIVLQGNSASSTGVAFGQGVRCVAGTLQRLYMKTASGGSITAPQGSDLHVHARSAALGDTIAPGTHRYYGVYYRDPTVLGGCPASSTFNITQQLDVLWGA